MFVHFLYFVFVITSFIDSSLKFFKFFFVCSLFRERIYSKNGIVEKRGEQGFWLVVDYPKCRPPLVVRLFACKVVAVIFFIHKILKRLGGPNSASFGFFHKVHDVL